MRNSIELSISNDQALVLFDWLARTSDLGVPASFEDQSEQRVLWDLLASLESALSEPLTTNYPRDLAAARGRVKDTAE